MSTLFQESNSDNEEKGSKKILFIAIGIAVVAVLVVIGLLSLKPSSTQVEQQALEGAYREGSPEFATLTKKVVAQSNYDKTTKSPVATGKIVMNIGGLIRNFTGKTLTGLELNVGMVDSFGKIVKEKNVIVIPKQRETLENNQTMEVRVTIEGFEPDADLANIRWKVTAIKVE